MTLKKEDAYGIIFHKKISCLSQFNDFPANMQRSRNNSKGLFLKFFSSFLLEEKGRLLFLLQNTGIAYCSYPLNFSKLLLPQEEGYYQEARDNFVKEKNLVFGKNGIKK